MTATSTVSAFHQWLLASAPKHGADCSIVLHGAAAVDTNFAAKIAAHLNQYDDSSEPAWLDVASSLIASIAGDSNHRSMLGIADACPNCPPTSPCGLKKTIVALANRGRVILDSPLAAAATSGMDRVFHVAIGLPPAGLDECHLIINPERFPASCIPGVIGDVFLEWLNCPHRLKPALRGL